jgi:hypothetical protein
MTVIRKTSKDGGGCGCGAGGCTGNCGGNCGGACATVGSALCPEGAIARPRFFAGQLLTQEDLQLIVDYAVGKNRLHNRFLFGEGVVCGLTVTCPPCGDGTVVVAPGYALDCCGNDIYVPCRQEVDINALVRELRLRQLEGWDCGDPCKDKRCDDDDDKDEKRDPDKPKPATYHYCLYIKYRETKIEPVAPYMSEAACGAIACEPSRICEGYSFELRCEKKPDPADILDRIRLCIGDLKAAAAASQKAQVNSARAAEINQAAALANMQEIGLREADLRAMDAATDRLRNAKLRDEAAVGRLDETAVRRHLADYQLLGVGVARANKLVREERGRDFGKTVESARGMLRETTEPLRALTQNLIVEPTTRAVALELFELTEHYAISSPETGLDSAEARMFRAGAPASSKQLSRMRVDAAQLKMFLRERLERSTSLTSCDLLDRLHAVRVEGDDEFSVAGASSAARANEELAMILLEYLRDCICLAFNPICTPCDDPAVLLACFDVRDCEVVEICNMSRRFVLSPAALRYWLPPITALGKLLERFCCELEFKRQRYDPPASTDRQPILSAERSFFRTGAARRVETATLDPEIKMAINTFGLELADVEQATLLAGNLGVLGVSKVPMVTDLGRVIRGVLDTRAERQPPAEDIGRLRTELKREIATTVAAERDATLKAARTEANRLVEERVAKIPPVDVAGAVKDELETALSDEALNKRLSAAKAVKELTAENRSLRAEVRRLSEAVKKLQG